MHLRCSLSYQRYHKSCINAEGTWVEMGPRRNSWNAVVDCPGACIGYVHDDNCFLFNGSAAGRFSPPMSMSGSTFDQQQMTECVKVEQFSPRAMHWSKPAKGAFGMRPVLHSFNYPLGTVRGFRQKFTIEDAIGSHACSFGANMRVANGIPLGSQVHLTG
jgi:hypothetical protein